MVLTDNSAQSINKVLRRICNELSFTGISVEDNSMQGFNSALANLVRRYNAENNASITFISVKDNSVRSLNTALLYLQRNLGI